MSDYIGFFVLLVLLAFLFKGDPDLYDVLDYKRNAWINKLVDENPEHFNADKQPK